MKVILTEDIKGVGKKGDIIDAADGYARNFLLPKKKAVEATKGSVNELEQKRKSALAKAEKELEKARNLAEELREKTVKVYVKAGEGGKLFGSVTASDIASSLAQQYGLTIDRKKITLPETVKSTGVYAAQARLHTEVTAEIQVEVIAK